MANSINGSSADKFELDPLWQNLDWYVLSSCHITFPLRRMAWLFV
jgi:hypothetical protein